MCSEDAIDSMEEASEKLDEVIELLDGIRCGFKTTSCPDQLANALKEYKNKRD